MTLEEKIVQFFALKKEVQIPSGFTITKNFLETIAWSDITPAEFGSLFESGLSENGQLKYSLEYYCSVCDQLFLSPFSRSKSIEVLKNYRNEREPSVTCSACAERKKLADKERKKRDHEEEREKFISEKPRRIELILSGLLNPEGEWKVSSSLWFDSINIHPSDREDFAKLVCQMPYSEFLRTPYWRAVATHVKYKAGRKCQVCGSRENLAAHHRSYALHGYEHTWKGLKELTCLCDGCHKAHHFGI